MVQRQRVDGTDLSHYQGRLDLAAARAAGLRWVVNKATEGLGFFDTSYVGRRAEAAKAGLPFGGYHFARPSAGSARPEARRFLSVAEPVPGDVKPTLDLEVTGQLTAAELRRWAAGFSAEVRRQLGVDPIIYGPFDLGEAAGDSLAWRPRYGSSNTPPSLPWDIWQFSNGVLGVPNSFPGLGHVDLDTMRKGLRLQDLLIPKAKPPARWRLVEMAHVSMQYRDSRREHGKDVQRIMARAQEKRWAWVTGTEAGPGSKGLDRQLARAAEAGGYRFFQPDAPTDCWVMVREDLIVGGWEAGYDKIIPASKDIKAPTDGRWGEKGLVRVGFDTADLGRINLGVAHYLHNSRQAETPNWRWNRKLAGHIGDWAVEEGAGSALVFYAGDQNMNDHVTDTFFGEPLLSLWDELQTWQSTGHGNIDLIATYNRDARVEAEYVRALSDAVFPLNTDHFLVEGGVRVKLLGAGRG